MNKQAVLTLIALLTSTVILCQPYSGKIFVTGTRTAVGFVNVGISGKNIGTVSDVDGNFTINLASDNNCDSLRFSTIGFESKSLLIKDFIDNPAKKVYLEPKAYNLREIKITYHRDKKIRLGNPVTSQDLMSGFAENELGSELGIKVSVRNQTVLSNINLNVAKCTYDTVTYRMNIYQIVEGTLYKNILTDPIFISFSKDAIRDVIVCDLKKYSITVKGDILIALELYKDLGDGELEFNTEFYTGITYRRKASQGKWIQQPGVIGMYLNGYLIK